MRRPTRDEVRVFSKAAEFRAWLEDITRATPELWVGYYRKSTGKSSITYPEAVEEALCFGWIDGLTYRIDDEVHANRYTPRRKGSSWSAPNIAKVAELKAAGRMHPAGLRAFEERDRSKGHAVHAGPSASSAAALLSWRRGFGPTPRPGRTGKRSGQLPEGGRVLDPVRQAGGDAGAPARHADRGVRRRPAAQAASPPRRRTDERPTAVVGWAHDDRRQRSARGRGHRSRRSAPRRGPDRACPGLRRRPASVLQRSPPASAGGSAERQARFDAGELPDFLPNTAHVRARSATGGSRRRRPTWTTAGWRSPARPSRR